MEMHQWHPLLNQQMGLVRTQKQQMGLVRTKKQGAGKCKNCESWKQIHGFDKTASKGYTTGLKDTQHASGKKTPAHRSFRLVHIPFWYTGEQRVRE